jgi:hypothetical protein
MGFELILISFFIYCPVWVKFCVTDLYMLCVTFWVVLRRMVFNSRCFGTLCLFHLHRHPLAYEDGTGTVFQNVGY